MCALCKVQHAATQYNVPQHDATQTVASSRSIRCVPCVVLCLACHCRHSIDARRETVHRGMHSPEQRRREATAAWTDLLERLAWKVRLCEREAVPLLGKVAHLTVRLPSVPKSAVGARWMQRRPIKAGRSLRRSCAGTARTPACGRRKRPASERGPRGSQWCDVASTTSRAHHDELGGAPPAVGCGANGVPASRAARRS